MKYFLTSLILLLSFIGTAQIISQDENKTKKPTEQEELTSTKEKTIALFFSVTPAYTFRTLGVNEGLFSKPLGIKEDEYGEWTTGYHIGIRNKLSDHLKFSIGAGYSQNKESYDFEQSDSVYRYRNSYRHISFPIQLAFTFGNDISFYGGIGIIPKAFISMKQDKTTLDINGNEATESTIYKEKFNSILIDAVVSVGTQIKLNENYGIFAMVEARRQLNNNFNNQSPYIRKPFAIGLNVGVEVYF